MSYQDVKDRLYHGHRKIANNTYLALEPETTIFNLESDKLLPYPELIQMRLHGNVVAIFYPNHFELFSVGWHTTTAKNSLNLAILIGLWSYSGYTPEIYQADYQWYYGNYLKFYDGMKIGYDGEVIQ